MVSKMMRTRGRWELSFALIGAVGLGSGCNKTDNPSADEGDGSGVLTLGGSSSSAEAGDSGKPKLDVGDGTATAGNTGGDCPGSGGMDGDVEFSLIWIANSPEGTVSKIDTKHRAWNSVAT